MYSLVTQWPAPAAAPPAPPVPPAVPPAAAGSDFTETQEEDVAGV